LNLQQVAQIVACNIAHDYPNLSNKFGRGPIHPTFFWPLASNSNSHQVQFVHHLLQFTPTDSIAFTKFDHLRDQQTWEVKN